jgi:hypothetical protein
MRNDFARSLVSCRLHWASRGVDNGYCALNKAGLNVAHSAALLNICSHKLPQVIIQEVSAVRAIGTQRFDLFYVWTDVATSLCGTRCTRLPKKAVWLTPGNGSRYQSWIRPFEIEQLWVMQEFVGNLRFTGTHCKLRAYMWHMSAIGWCLRHVASLTTLL